MTAKIYEWPISFPQEQEIPSISAMISTLKLNYWDELSRSQKDIILTAEQLAMRNEETAYHLKAVHQIYLKITSRTLLERINDFVRRLG